MTNEIKTIHDIEQGELLKIIETFNCDLLKILNKYSEKNYSLRKQIKMCLNMKNIMENYIWGTTYIRFTPKEFEVLELLLFSIPDKEILKQLNITQHTLNTHYQNIAKKIYDNEINKFYKLENYNYLKSPKTAIRKYLTNSIMQIMFREIGTDTYIFETLKNVMPDTFS